MHSQQEMKVEMVLCKDVMLRIYFKLLMIKSYLQFKFSSLFFVHHLNTFLYHTNDKNKFYIEMKNKDTKGTTRNERHF